MTADAGTSEIAARFAAGFGVGVAAGPRGSSDQAIAQVVPGLAGPAPRRLDAFRFVPMPPVGGAPAAGALLLTGAQCGPADGLCWAVQRITVGGLATADTMLIYKGPQPTLAMLPQIMNQIGVPLTGASPSYHAGGKGIVMNDSEVLAVYGTGLTSLNAVLTADVIEFESCYLPDYLV